MKGQPDLSQVITAGNAPARFARCLDGRQADRAISAADDGDHDQQFDQRKTATPQWKSLKSAAPPQRQAQVRAKQRLTTRVLRGNQALCRGNSIAGAITRRINGPFSAHAEAGMLCAGRSSDFRVRSSRPSRRSFRRLNRNDSCDNGQKNGGPSFTFDKTLGYSGGAVPESHRVPCTSALPQERPTTNAQFKHPVCYLNAKGKCQVGPKSKKMRRASVPLGWTSALPPKIKWLAMKDRI